MFFLLYLLVSQTFDDNHHSPNQALDPGTNQTLRARSDQDQQYDRLSLNPLHLPQNAKMHHDLHYQLNHYLLLVQ